MPDNDSSPGLDIVKDMTGEQIENLAEAAHAVFCEGLRARGYTWGTANDESRRVSSALVPYADLPEQLKEQNRGNVRDILRKLASAGYVIIPHHGHAPLFEFPNDVVEKLAEQEHERWMEQKRVAGWSYGAETDQAQKRHAALVPWSQLSSAQQAKDRDLVRGIPRILSRAGYTISPARR